MDEVKKVGVQPSEPSGQTSLEDDELGIPAPTNYKMAEAMEKGKAQFEIVKDTPPIDLEVHPIGVPPAIPRFKKPIPNAARFETVLANLTERWSEWGIRDDRWRYYALAAYLFGARTTETLQIRGGDCKEVRIKGHPFFQVELITLKKKSTWQNPDGTHAVQKYDKVEGGGFIRAKHDPTKEIKIAPSPDNRSIAIPMEKLPGVDIDETPLIYPLVEYIKGWKADDYIFNFTDTDPKTKDDLKIERDMAYHNMEKIDFGPLTVRYYNAPGQPPERRTLEHFPAYNHFFRHTRLTVLARHYHFNDRQLQQWCGWKDPKMAQIYTHMEAEDIGAAFLMAGIGPNGV